MDKIAILVRSLVKGALVSSEQIAYRVFPGKLLLYSSASQPAHSLPFLGMLEQPQHFVRKIRYPIAIVANH